MSSSTGSPSRKLSWVKKMEAECAYEAKLLDAARRGQLKTSTKPAHTLSKKEKKANAAIELAIELKRREEKQAEVKKQQQKKEEAKA